MRQQDYIAQPLNVRQQHLKLDQPCVYRGGTSQHHKGVLAQFLDTEIYGRPVDLCHKCGDGNCSNPRHLYWGTRSENVRDAMISGTMKTMWIKLVEKVVGEWIVTTIQYQSSVSPSAEATKTPCSGQVPNALGEYQPRDAVSGL